MLVTGRLFIIAHCREISSFKIQIHISVTGDDTCTIHHRCSWLSETYGLILGNETFFTAATWNIVTLTVFTLLSPANGTVKVMFSVMCVCVRVRVFTGCPPYRAMPPCTWPQSPSLYRALLPPSSPQVCSNLFRLDLTLHETPPPPTRGRRSLSEIRQLVFSHDTRLSDQIKLITSKCRFVIIVLNYRHINPFTTNGLRLRP